nr:hypothetical protein [uncultured Cellulosilyticum sp.]
MDFDNKIIDNLQYFCGEGSTFEVRVFINRGIKAGIFNDVEEILVQTKKYNQKGCPVYMTINPIKDDYLKDKPINELVAVKEAVKDKDIAYLSKIMIDFNPVRPSNISSTDEEKAEAKELLKKVRQFLGDNGFPKPMLCDSGNGYHLFYVIDLDNTKENVGLIKKFLRTLDKLFSNDKVKIDVTTGNASRITRLYGTVNCKGDNTEDRPHRMSKILRLGEEVIVEKEQLQAIVAMLPEEEKPKSIGCSTSTGRIDVNDWLEKVGLKESIVEVKPYLDDATMWILNPCPWNAEHTNNSAFIIQFANGAVMAKCHHNSCANENWQTLRAKYEPNNSTNEEEQPKGIKLLLQLVDDDGVEFLIDENATPRAIINLKGYKEVVKLTEAKFSSYLNKRYYSVTNLPLKSDMINQAVALFNMKAETSDRQEKINKRLADYSQDGKIYYDLKNLKGTLIKVTKDKVKKVKSNKVCFAKSKNMAEQVEPNIKIKPERLVKLIQKNFRFKSDNDCIMFTVYLVSAFFESIQHPILVLYGEKGASKSTSLRKLKKIVDPGMQELLTLPSKTKDLIITLSNNYLSCFDNLQYLSNTSSDILCMAVTGGAYTDRTLYTNDEENIISFRRLVALNGINIVATNADLVDRSFFIELERIPENERKTEVTVWKEFEEDLPKILGSIFNTVSRVLAIEEEPEIESVGRLADFTYLGYKISEVLGIGGEQFVNAYLENQNRANDETLNAHPVAAAILKLMVDKHEYVDSVTKLLKDIREIAEEEMFNMTSKLWPKDAASLSKRLREIKSNLEQKSIFYDIRHIGQYKEITIHNKSVKEATNTSMNDDLELDE